MTVTTNEFGQNNLFAKEPPMVVEDYNRKGLFSPMQQRNVQQCWARWELFLDSFPTLLLVNYFWNF